MKEFKGCVIPYEFAENIDKIEELAKGDSPCNSEVSNFVLHGYCYDTCSTDKCILSCLNRAALCEYLETLESPQPFAVGTVIPCGRELVIMASFVDGDDRYYAVKHDGLYVISEKKLIKDTNKEKESCIDAVDKYKRIIDLNKVKIESLEKLLEGKE